jgi:hypothetical protein
MKYEIKINVDVPDKCGDIYDNIYGIMDASSGVIDDISKYACRRQENSIYWDVQRVNDDILSVEEPGVKRPERNYSSLDLFLKMFNNFASELKDENQDALQRELELRDLTVIANTVRKAMLNDFK